MFDDRCGNGGARVAQPPTAVARCNNLPKIHAFSAWNAAVGLLQKGQRHMATARSYRDLDAWNVAMNLVELTYRLTAVFPTWNGIG